jgi:hypothetical protein
MADRLWSAAIHTTTGARFSNVGVEDVVARTRSKRRTSIGRQPTAVAAKSPAIALFGASVFVIEYQMLGAVVS